MLENGASRGTRISWRRSFNVTSAARSIRLLQAPVAMADKVPVEHGTTTMAAGEPEPDLPIGCAGVLGQKRLHHLRFRRQCDVGLGRHDQLRCLGNQKVHFAVFANQAIQKTQPVLRAGRAGHRQGNAFRPAHFSASANLPCRPPKPPLLMITT
jgi:hypothetical protein